MKRALLALVLLGVAAAAASAWSAGRRDARYSELLDVGDAAAAAGDLVAAVEAFSGAIGLKPEAMPAYLKRGEVYRRRGELEIALRDVRRAADLDLSSTRARELLGDISYEMERFARAADRYGEYLALDDSAPRILYKLGLARYRAGQPDACVAAARRALVLESGMAESYYLLGLCLRETSGPQEALAALERAIALAPAMLQAREELAAVHGALNRPEDRIAQLEAVLGLDPGAPREIAVGLAHAAVGDHGSAVQTLSRAARRYPTDRRIYLALGRVWLEEAGADDPVALGKAIEALQTAAGDEDNAEALTLYGRALLLAGNLELAERTLQLATGKLPVDPAAYFHLAEAAERLGHYEIARQALLDFEALAPDGFPARRARIALRLADLSLRLDDPAAAVRHYQRALAANASADASTLVRFAEAQARTHDVEGARATLQRALAIEPAHAAAIRLLRRLQPAPMAGR